MRLLIDNIDQMQSYFVNSCPGPAQARAPLGLIGGMSWHSTAHYYTRLNTLGEERGGTHENPVSLIETVCFAELLKDAERGDWAAIEGRLTTAGMRLAQAGCAAVAITAVTAHRAHAAVAAMLDIPVPHIFDAAAMKLASCGAIRPGILATSRTLADGTLVERIAGGRPLVRLDSVRQTALDSLILERLTMGRIDTHGRDMLDSAIDALADSGADAVLLACTELPLLIGVPSARARDHVAPQLIDAVDAHVNTLLDLQKECQ